jgi:hypothetical protein
VGVPRFLVSLNILMALQNSLGSFAKMVEVLLARVDVCDDLLQGICMLFQDGIDDYLHFTRE